MSIFVVNLTTNADKVKASIRSLFPTDHMEVNASAMLVAFAGSAVDLSHKLGITSPNDLNPEAQLGGLVTQVASYFGRANPAIWAFMKSKWGN